MSAADALGLFKEFGLMGLFVGFLIWDKLRLDAKWRRIEEKRIEAQAEQEKARLAQEKELAEKRFKIDEGRIATDKEMVLTLQALTFQVTGRISR